MMSRYSDPVLFRPISTGLACKLHRTPLNMCVTQMTTISISIFLQLPSRERERERERGRERERERNCVFISFPFFQRVDKKIMFDVAGRKNKKRNLSSSAGGTVEKEVGICILVGSSMLPKKNLALISPS